MRLIYLVIIICFILSCGSNEDIVADGGSTINQEENATVLDVSRNYASVIESFDTSLLELALKVPDKNGALGRNKSGYFHVRFQLTMTSLTNFAIKSQRTDVLETFINTIQYAFVHQLAEGDFQLIIPEELIELAENSNESDLASGVAFFASSLAISFNSLNETEWYLNHTDVAVSRHIITSYNSDIQQMLDYLKSVKAFLFNVDSNAPNRLLYNAVAYYGLGKYLNDIEAKEIGIQFALDAINLNNDAGDFTEGGGSDTSYNGVALQLGLELFMLLPEDHKIKGSLANALAESASWQLTRIEDTGEISTQGNTRVFPGGESFLGNEKGVDYAKTVKAFLYISILGDLQEYRKVALKILDFYN